MFKTCPAKYNFQYNQNRRSIPSPAMERGSLVHKWISERVETGKRPGFSVADFTDQQAKELEAFVSMPGSDWQIGTELEWALAEDFATFVEFDADKAVLHGIIDFIAVHQASKQILLVDWKTGKSNAEDFQIEVYFLVVSLLWPGYGVSVWYYYPDKKRGEKEKEVLTRPAARIEVEVKELIEKINTETTWRGCSDWHCRFCDFAPECVWAEQKKDELAVETSSLSALVGR